MAGAAAPAAPEGARASAHEAAARRPGQSGHDAARQPGARQQGEQGARQTGARQPGQEGARQAEEEAMRQAGQAAAWQAEQEAEEEAEEEAVRDFGQKVDLCQRIRDVLANYPEAALLKEMVQNADDAGASTFRVLLDCRTHASSTLIGPGMARFQGPALLTYNDAVFTDKDFESIQHIGGSWKTSREACSMFPEQHDHVVRRRDANHALQARAKTGRFGVGFNSSYHVTDLPGFVSRRYMVLLDPHCLHLPNVTHAEPGKIINFLKPGLLERYSDQFAPFKVFGLDLSSDVRGTVFRLPLRTSEQAASSRISARPCTIENAEQLVREFAERLSEAALFLTHIHTLEVEIWREGEQAATTLKRLQVQDCTGNAPRRERLHELVRDAHDDVSAFPMEEHSMELRMEHGKGSAEGMETWLVVQTMGGGKASEMAINADVQAHGLKPLPWGGVAARFSSRSQADLCVIGRPYCLLPLPATTGLPVHVNGFFELSSNRRDIWYGDDMVGSGRLRAEWNSALLQDVVAPSYSSLLLQVREKIRTSGGSGGCAAGYYALWPSSRPPEPWGSLVDVLYQMMLQQPALYSELHGGTWVSPVGAVFAGQGSTAVSAMESALVRSGMPIVHVPSSVEQLLRAAAKQLDIELRRADPPMVRSWLAAQQDWESGLTREEGVELLEHCLLELAEEDVSQLYGLRLLPLVDGSWGRLEAATSKDAPLLLCGRDTRPLVAHRPALVVDVDVATPLGEKLVRVAATRQLNLYVFAAELLPSVLPHLIPTHWRGLEVATLKQEDFEGAEASERIAGNAASDDPSGSWLLLLWKFIGRHHAHIQLGDLTGWPLLPIEGELKAYALPDGGLLCSRMLDLRDVDTALSNCLRKAGCLALHHGVSRVHPQLQRVVHELSACGILRALREAAGGTASGTEALRHRVSKRFEGVNADERRLLRSVLMERRHVEERELRGDQGLVEMLRGLPVYEVHTSSRGSDEAGNPSAKTGGEDRGVGNTFVALVLEKHRLPPSDVSVDLLDESFIRCDHVNEVGLLVFAGLRQIERSRFYVENVFPRLHLLSMVQRNQAMLSVLHGLHGLCTEDSSFLERLRALAFVPVESGALRRASELFHPKVSEAAELLGRSEVYPSGDFSDEAVLGVLERLGMRVQVNRQAVLQSARSIEALSETDADAAVRRARALLQYVDLHANRLIDFESSTSHFNVKAAESWLRPVLSKAFGSLCQDGIDLDIRELAQIAWLPVLTDRPVAHLPWDDAWCHVPLAPASMTRPVEDMWLVSSRRRLLDGDVRSKCLRNFLGWTKPPTLDVLASQLAALPLTSTLVDHLEYERSMALAVPALYKALDSSFAHGPGDTEDEACAAKIASLGQKACIWVGRTFVFPANTALRSPFNLSPYLYTVPADLQCFRLLLERLGVRTEFESTQYIHLLEKLASSASGATQSAETLPVVLAIVQHLASPKHQPLPQEIIFVPDRTNVLIPSHELMFDDTPWLDATFFLADGAKSSRVALPAEASKWRWVHPDVSHEVAERLGAQSLRRWLINRNADTLALGQSNIEAFGQHESLTSRLHNILELYADGVGILHELIQNADDAGATRIAFLLDETPNGEASLLSPMMRAWQGPALYSYNDSTFNAHDFRNICAIGSNAKLARCNAIGRFGLGFNSVYHFTDVPSFVSGEHVVFFDPHAKWLPGATAQNPGLKIRFSGAGYIDQFPDQFSPYLHFGCDMSTPFDGTLFRFPLRTADVAASSELRKEAYSCSAVLSLLNALRVRGSDLLLFLKHIRVVEFYHKKAHKESKLLFSVRREALSPSVARPSDGAVKERTSGSPEKEGEKIMNFLWSNQANSGKTSNGPSTGDFYHLLQTTDPKRLPKETKRLRLTVSQQHVVGDVASMITMVEEWIVCNSLGQGAPRICKMCLTPEGRQLKLMPWGGAAARLSANEIVGHSEEEEGPAEGMAGSVKQSVKGQAFCFLPLPTETGLPVHTNGYFELSSNRRDIWYGDDMVGSGRLRAEWNSALLQDVVAPSYSSLLLQVREKIRTSGGTGECAAGYYALWPSSRPPEPWGSLVDVLYQMMLQQPALYSELHGGTWVSPVGAVFTGQGSTAVTAMESALVRSGMPIVHVPSSVEQLLRSAAKQLDIELRRADPPMVRSWLAAQQDWESGLTREEGVELLEHCLLELAEEDVSQLYGLRLLPLVDGSWGRLEAATSKDAPLLLCGRDTRPLVAHRPALVVDVDVATPLGEKLVRVAATRQLNLHVFAAELLPSVLPHLIPAHWRGLEVATLKQEDSEGAEASERIAGNAASNDPSGSWLLLLWKFIGRHHAHIQLGDLTGWPLLPIEGELKAYALPDGGLLCSRMLDLRDVDTALSNCLRKAGCLALHHGVSRVHPQLQRVVHELSACGILRALREAAGGTAGGTEALRRRVSERFEGVNADERRLLRSVLMERRHVEERELRGDQGLVEMLCGLPVYEVHTSSRGSDEASNPSSNSGGEDRRVGSTFVALVLEKHRLPPSDVSVDLLDECFIRCDHMNEVGLLVFAGLRQMERSRFYVENVFPRLHLLSMVQRNQAMLSVLHGLHGLCTEDSSFLERLRALAFVPVESGALRRASELFHPKVSEAAELLGRSEVYPSGDFSDEAVLGVLERLGMRVQVNRQAVLQSARSIEALSETDADAAVRRARALLQYVDIHADAIFSSEAQGDVEEFTSELLSLAWLPVAFEPHHLLMPWDGTRRLVEAPNAVRPPEDAWLVSHCLATLDGKVRSSSLRQVFGWDQPPRPAVVCAQLIHCASRFTPASSPDEELLWLQLLTPAYERLMAVVDTPEISGVCQMLRTRPCLWVSSHHGFLSPEHVAFEACPVKSRYLGHVTGQLLRFESLLRALGVRDSFSARDYAHVNACFVRDFGSRALPPEELSTCVAALHASDCIPDGSECSAAYFLPDVDGVLRPAPDLTFDDAPWLSSALRQRPDNGGVFLVHSSINDALAERLGARSLRYLLLLEEQLNDVLPCPSAEELRHSLGEAGNEAHVLLDLLEAADGLGAKAAHFVLDGRDHPKQSLISHALAPFQSEALCLFLPGVSLSTEDICRMHMPGTCLSVSGENSNLPRVGKRLMSMYHLSEVAWIASKTSLYIFDPSGNYLVSSLAPASSLSNNSPISHDGQSPVARVYPLVPAELPKRFPDQFAPLAMFGFRPAAGVPLDGTLIRLPLRSHSLAARSAINRVFWSSFRMRSLLLALRKDASTMLLGLRHVEVLSTSEWLPSYPEPTRTLQVSLCLPQADAVQRGTLANDSSWKSSSILSFFTKPAKRESIYVADVAQVFRDITYIDLVQTDSIHRYEDVAGIRSAAKTQWARVVETNPDTANQPVVDTLVVLKASITNSNEEAALPTHHAEEGESSAASLESQAAQGLTNDPTEHSLARNTQGAHKIEDSRVEQLAGVGVTNAEMAHDGRRAQDHRGGEGETSIRLKASGLSYGIGAEQVHTDRWLLSEVMAIGQSRHLALEPRFAAKGALPLGGSAAHLLHDGIPPQTPLGGQILSPVPLPTCTGLPVHIFGHFELNSMNRTVPLSSQSSHADELQCVEWNRELFACIRASLLALLNALPEHLKMPNGPEVKCMYKYWPTATPLAHEELDELLLRGLYAAAADSPLFLAPPREIEADTLSKKVLRKLDEGFVCPTTIGEGVENFVRQHFTVFDLPPSIADQLITSSPHGIRLFQPSTLRQYLKRKLSDPKKREMHLSSNAWGALQSPNFVLDLLAFCVEDLTDLLPRHSRGRSDDTARTRRSLRPGRFSELNDLFLLPLATGELTALGGKANYVVASHKQQAMLPNLVERFVNAQCVEHTEVGSLFTESPEFLRAAGLRELDLDILACELHVPLTPSVEWLHTFWATVSSRAKYAERGLGMLHIPQLSALFKAHPLLPLYGGACSAIKELSHTLILPEELMHYKIDDQATRGWESETGYTTSIGASATDQESLLDLSKSLGMPLLHPDFVRMPNGHSQIPGPIGNELGGYFAADAMDERSLPAAIIDKFAANLHKLNWSSVALRSARALVQFFAETAAASEAGLGDESDGQSRFLRQGRLEALKTLPIFETIPDPTHGSHLVNLEEQRYLLVRPHPFFNPQEASFLSPHVSRPVLNLLERLGVLKLSDAMVFEKFLLPNFASSAKELQTAQRAHILKNWQALRQNDDLVLKLRETPFVPVCGRLLRPCDVIDPRVGVLNYVFGGEDVFPDPECATESWLSVLASLGMKTSIDSDAFLACARQVEALGRVQPIPSPDVLSRAALLTSHLTEHFVDLVSDASGESNPDRAFCARLRVIRFIPCHVAVTGADPHEGEPCLAAFEELALHQDRSLLWTQAPLLQSSMTPPPSYWRSLGILHPPPMELVLAHVRELVTGQPDLWPYKEPIRETFGALLSFLDEQWPSMNPVFRHAFGETPLLLCGSTFNKPRRVFRSVFATCSPLLTGVDSISCRPYPTNEVLVGLGIGSEPGLQEYLQLLLELPKEFGTQRLTPSERRALLSILSLASECTGFKANPQLAVLLEDGRIAPVEAAAVNDAPWLLSRVNHGVVQTCSPAVDLVLRARLKIRKLSDVLIPELAEESIGEADNLCDPLRSLELTNRLHDINFAAAASRVLGAEAAKVDHSLLGPPRNLHTDAISSALLSFKVSIVKRLQTELRHAFTGELVTAPAAALQHFPWFVDNESKTILLLAVPPLAISHEHFLNQAICELLRCSSPASLAPLLNCELSDMSPLVNLLHIKSPEQWKRAQALGTPGTHCTPQDEGMLQLQPLRPYFCGEVVAIDGALLGLHDGYIYAEVDRAFFSLRDEDMVDYNARLTLRVGENQEVVQVLPLHVHSFRSFRSFSREQNAAVDETVLPSEVSANEAQGSLADGASSGRRSEELVAAVATVLRQAGVPIGLDQRQLLDSNLALKAEIAHLRSELEESRVEMAKANQTIETNERSFLCQICFQRRVNVVLQTCGHMLCHQCSTHVERCPFCRGELTGSIRLRW